MKNVRKTKQGSRYRVRRNVDSDVDRTLILRKTTAHAQARRKPRVSLATRRQIVHRNPRTFHSRLTASTQRFYNGAIIRQPEGL
jgi:hypothetical protein